MTNLVKPLVSVKTITYYHVPFIQRCIESVLMQKTTLPFKFVIGEDCSTDGTRAIVMDYA
jgi:glycosyltransferase involved in cell wall biosynthesis